MAAASELPLTANYRDYQFIGVALMPESRGNRCFKAEGEVVEIDGKIKVYGVITQEFAEGQTKSWKLEKESKMIVFVVTGILTVIGLYCAMSLTLTLFPLTLSPSSLTLAVFSGLGLTSILAKMAFDNGAQAAIASMNLSWWSSQVQAIREYGNIASRIRSIRIQLLSSRGTPTTHQAVSEAFGEFLLTAEEAGKQKPPSSSVLRVRDTFEAALNRIERTIWPGGLAADAAV